MRRNSVSIILGSRNAMSDSKGFLKAMTPTLAWIAAASFTAFIVIYLENIGMGGIGGGLVGGLMSSLYSGIRAAKNNHEQSKKTLGRMKFLLALLVVFLSVLCLNNWRANGLAIAISAALGSVMGDVIMPLIYRNLKTN